MCKCKQFLSAQTCTLKNALTDSCTHVGKAHICINLKKNLKPFFWCFKWCLPCVQQLFFHCHGFFIKKSEISNECRSQTLKKKRKKKACKTLLDILQIPFAYSLPLDQWCSAVNILFTPRDVLNRPLSAYS